MCEFYQPICCACFWFFFLWDLVLGHGTRNNREHGTSEALYLRETFKVWLYILVPAAQWNCLCTCVPAAMCSQEATAFFLCFESSWWNFPAGPHGKHWFIWYAQTDLPSLWSSGWFQRAGDTIPWVMCSTYCFHEWVVWRSFQGKSSTRIPRMWQDPDQLSCGSFTSSTGYVCLLTLKMSVL